MRATIVGEYRTLRVRRAGHFYLPLWCVDRINTAGIEWFDTGVAFDTKAQALAYITERTP